MLFSTLAQNLLTHYTKITFNISHVPMFTQHWYFIGQKDWSFIESCCIRYAPPYLKPQPAHQQFIENIVVSQHIHLYTSCCTVISYSPYVPIHHIYTLQPLVSFPFVLSYAIHRSKPLSIACWICLKTINFKKIYRFVSWRFRFLLLHNKNLNSTTNPTGVEI